mmetsp:Transcript_12853/g.22179  ORF Transcript_12853/g.22179 Transcript_12853/m.22179 type:complete len:238 (-) Transcript_12853:364-1077(-)
MEARHPSNGTHVPGHRLLGLPPPQPAHRRSEVRRSRQLLGPRLDHAPLVRHLGSFGLPGQLLRHEKGAGRVPCAHEPDPATDPGPGVVHAAGVLDPHRRHPSLRRRVHRAVLHPVLPVAPPVLLHVHFPLHRLRHPRPHLRRDHHRPLLLPALQRGLPLVVEVVPHIRFVGALPLCVLGVLLLHEARHGPLRLRPHVLRLHVHHLVRLLLPDRHHRLPRLLPVCPEDLCLGQGRLID